uniref:Type III-B CRISPR module RAMP protein Cmr1 n=1 Tax=Thermofilum adornatum TaxID=1365176 RepID=A0A7C1GLM5_9CREN
MVTLSTIQNKILEKENLVISVKARLLYPHIGGYTARPYDHDTGTLEPPRPTEIKALWRWWARSLLSGAYGGTQNYNFLDDKVGVFLGRAGGSSKSSLFSLTISATNYDAVKQHFSTYYNELKRKYNQLKRDLTNLIQDFSNIYLPRGTSNIWVQKVEITSFNSINLILKGNYRALNQVLREKGINLKAKLQSRRNKHPSNPPILNITPDKINELKKVNNFIKEKNPKKDYSRLILALEEHFNHSKISRHFLVSQVSKKTSSDEQIIGEVAVIDKYNDLQINIDLFATFPLRYQKISDDGKRYLNHLRMLRFAIWSYIASLVFGSIGYGSRRGLGSIIVQEIKENPDLLKYYPELETDLAKLKEIIATLNNDDYENIKKKLDELVKQAYEVAKGFKENFEEDSSHIANTSSFPEVPSVIPNSPFFKMKVYQCRDPLTALRCISKGTLKNEWLNVVGSSVSQPVYRSQLHTWILGLPRSSKGKGYYLVAGSRKDPGRRVSSIQFKLWQNKNKTFVIVYGFLSKDWKIDMLHHFARSKTQVSREDVVCANGQRFTPQNNNELLSKAFEAAWSFISEILNKYCSGGKNG